MTDHYIDRLQAAIVQKGNPCCVGLDPVYSEIAPVVYTEYERQQVGALALIADFTYRVIERVAPLVPVVKPNAAFFEVWGPTGMELLLNVLKFAKEKGLMTVLDVKRGDIGNSARAYARAYLDPAGSYGRYVDAITVEPYCGPETIREYATYAVSTGKGIYVLARTSNEDSHVFQDVGQPIPLYERVARIIGGGAARNYLQGEWLSSSDYGDNYWSCVGAVVGATHSGEAKHLRKLLPRTPFLVPGYGAQGGEADTVRSCFAEGVAVGAIVNSSRAILYPHRYRKGTPVDGGFDSIEAACKTFVADITKLDHG